MRLKEIEDYKKNLKLSSLQREIIVGLALGDGHLETLNEGKTYRLKVEHSLKQREYLDWLYLKETKRRPCETIEEIVFDSLSILRSPL